MLLRALPFLLLSSTAFAQGSEPTMLTVLQPPLHESSGLLHVDGQVWTHGDSGNPNSLYRIDPSNGDILREVMFTNAPNVDWEDVTTDGNWVFVGDFGNNLGSRTDLRIFRFPLSELLDDLVTQVVVDTIRFAYADQTDFTPANQATNWDCEAMVAMDDSLFLFTKNWEDYKCHLYVLPAVPGIHLAIRRDTLDAQGLITGAALDEVNGVIALVGYSPVLAPFVWRLSEYVENAFFDGVSARHGIQLSLTQMEAISWAAQDTVFMSNESGLFGTARLWSMYLGLDSSVPVLDTGEAHVFKLSPNPANAMVQVVGVQGPAVVRIVDEQGTEVMRNDLVLDGLVPVRSLAVGAYTMEVTTRQRIERHRLLIIR